MVSEDCRSQEIWRYQQEYEKFAAVAVVPRDNIVPEQKPLERKWRRAYVIISSQEEGQCRNRGANQTYVVPSHLSQPGRIDVVARRCRFSRCWDCTNLERLSFFGCWGLGNCGQIVIWGAGGTLFLSKQNSVYRDRTKAEGVTTLTDF